MSKEVGKARTAKRQMPPRKQGRRQTEAEMQDLLSLETRAESLTLSKDIHPQLLTQGESNDIQSGVEQLSREADKLRDIQ